MYPPHLRCAAVAAVYRRSVPFQDIFHIHHWGKLCGITDAASGHVPGIRSATPMTQVLHQKRPDELCLHCIFVVQMMDGWWPLTPSQRCWTLTHAGRHLSKLACSSQLACKVHSVNQANCPEQVVAMTDTSCRPSAERPCRPDIQLP